MRLKWAMENTELDVVLNDFVDVVTLEWCWFVGLYSV